MLEAVKFEHTIFALPFAYLGMVLAARAAHGWPGWDKLFWITVAMAGARTLARVSANDQRTLAHLFNMDRTPVGSSGDIVTADDGVPEWRVA